MISNELHLYENQLAGEGRSNLALTNPTANHSSYSFQISFPDAMWGLS